MHWAERRLPAALSPLFNNDKVNPFTSQKNAHGNDTFAWVESRQNKEYQYGEGNAKGYILCHKIF